MATPEEELRRRLRATVVRPSTEIPQAFREAGGGARGTGAATAEVIREGTIRPVVETGAALVRPVGEFLQGLILGAPSASSAPTARPRTTVQTPSLPTLVNAPRIVPSAPAVAAEPATRPPLRPGQTARPSVTQPQQPSAAPTYSLDSVPQGGGFISFDEPLGSDRVGRLPSYLRDQLQQTGAIRITPEQGRSLASQATVVPSSFFTGGTGQPAAVSPAPQTVGPQRSQLISDRSQDFDTLLKDLVSQATREPGSYGELFRRRGVLDALNQVAGVAQGAGTNLTQDITNLRDVLQRRRGDDLTAQSREADRGVTFRGQNLDFERGYLQTLLGAEAAQSQAAAAQERVKAMRERTAALTQIEKDRIAAQERAAAAKPVQDLAGDASKQLEAMYATAPPDQKPAILEMLRNLYAARNAAPPLIP